MSPGETLLIRGYSLEGALIKIGSAAGVTGVNLQNLTLCGGWVPPNSDYASRFVNDPVNGWGDQSDPCPNRPITHVQPDHGGYELEISGTGPALAQPGTGIDPDAPFGATNYNVTVTNIWIEASVSGHAVGLITSTTDSGRLNDVLFTGNTVSGGGIQMGSALPNSYSDYTQCDNWQSPLGYANDPAVSVPRNIHIEGNKFYANQGVVSGYGRYVKVADNTVDSYDWPVPDDGGIFELETCSDKAQIFHNSLNGHYSYREPVKDKNGVTIKTFTQIHNSGMELYGATLRSSTTPLQDKLTRRLAFIVRTKSMSTRITCLATA